MMSLFILYILFLKSHGDKGLVSEDWKKTNVMLILQKEDLGYYRPVSFTPILWNVMGQILLEIVSNDMKYSKSSESCQHGFNEGKIMVN